MATRSRVWFNETYRGTYQLIGLLRRTGRPLTVLGSHSTASTPFLQACDEIVAEPSETGDAFAGAALRICRERGVDVFVPGREMLAVSRRADDFAAAGVRLQVSPAAGIAALAGKTSTYATAASLGVPVPHTRTVRTLDGFRAAVEELTELTRGGSICFKPDLDFGGHGFRILDAAADTLAELTSPPSVRIGRGTAERLLGSVEAFPALIVSEYLEGAELSVDCLSTAGAELVAALPRRKSGLAWTRELVRDPAAIDIARAMVEGCGLRYLSNVQVRGRADGEAVLLEVNTRAASGLYQSCLAGDVNLPALALALVLGEPVDPPTPVYGKTVIVYNEAIPFGPAGPR